MSILSMGSRPGVGKKGARDSSAFFKTLRATASAAALLTALGFSAFVTGLVSASGASAFQIAAGVREVLTGARTYYVRTDGSDSNTGLVNSAGGGFLTIQKAINVIAALDISIYNVTIQVADGTYTGANTISGPWLGSGTVSIVGNTTTPANVIINPAGAACFSVSSAAVSLSGMELRGFFGALALKWSTVSIGTAMRFGTCGAYQVYASGGIITLSASYTISGGAGLHINADNGGVVQATSITVTLSGTPAFANYFLAAQGPGSSVIYYSNTFVGSATGLRYLASSGGYVSVNGAGTSYLPGNAAGSGTNFSASPWGLYQ
jgi:hypothetical protein